MTSFLAVFILLGTIIIYLPNTNSIVGLFTIYLTILFLGVEFWRVVDLLKDWIGRYWNYLKPPHQKLSDQFAEVAGFIPAISVLIPDAETIEFSDLSTDSLGSSVVVGLILLSIGLSIFLAIGFTIVSLEMLNLLGENLFENQPSVTTSFAALAVLLGRVFGIFALAIELALTQLNTNLVMFLIIMFGIPSIFIAPAIRNLIGFVEILHILIVRKITREQDYINSPSLILLILTIIYGAVFFAIT